MSDNYLNLEWCIENARPWFETRNDILYSPPILYQDTRWKLALTPNWQLAEKYINFTVYRDVKPNNDCKAINLTYKLEFLGCNGSTMHSYTGNQEFVPKTVSVGLNVRQDEIFEEKKKIYLQEGVLKVRCTMWGDDFFTLTEEYLLQSTIGTKCINLNATVTNYSPQSIVSVNFMPPSEDISLISLDVYVDSYDFIFKRKRVDCKIFSWCSFQLFALGSSGEKTRFKETNDITNFSTIIGSSRPMPTNDGTLRLQLEIVYYPGVVSESTEEIS